MPWTQKQMLRDANGDLIPQYWDVVEQEFKPLTGQGGANDVRLTGRNVEEVAFFDALAITDTSAKISQSIDMSKYKAVTWHFRNSHDVDIFVYLQIDGGTTHVYEPGTGWVNTQSTNNRIVLPANTLRMVLKQSILPELYSNVYARPVRWVAIASSTPTSGSLSVFGWGVPN